MKLKDLKMENAETYTFSIVDSERRPTPGEVIQLVPYGSNGLGGVSLQRNHKQTYFFEYEDTYKRDSLLTKLQRGHTNLAEVQAVTDDEYVIIHLVFFSGPTLQLEEIKIAIDDEVSSRIEKKDFHRGRGFFDRLRSTFQIEGTNLFVILAGTCVHDDLEEEEIEMIQSQFTLVSDSMRIPVEVREIKPTPQSSKIEMFWATKAVFSALPQHHTRSLRLVQGQLFFDDWRSTGRISGLAAGVMNQIIKQSDSYLRKWDEYGREEGELLLKKLRDIGHLKYSGYERSKSGYKLFIEGHIPEALSVRDTLEFVDELPEFLQDREITWDTYVNSIREGGKIRNRKRKSEEDEEKSSSEFLRYLEHPVVTQIESGSITIKMTIEPPPDLMLVYSVLGDQIQIERREVAREMVLKGRAGMPMLGLIIEEGGEIPAVKLNRKIKPLSHFVRNKIFKHPPTDRQVEAIEVALNTPDIALIQGPPGTGKTTVITAILERLNELAEDRKHLKGQVLVSGFQHDAVENLIQRLSVNSIPAVKFGGKGRNEEDPLQLNIQHWCEELSDRLRTKNPQLRQTKNQKKLLTLSQTYEQAPTDQNAAKLIHDALALPRHILNDELVQELNQIKNDLRDEPSRDHEKILPVIWGIRVTHNSFMDDGQKSLLQLKLLHSSGELSLTPDQLSFIEKMGRQAPDKSDYLLLKKLRDELIERYSPRPQYRVSKPRVDILNIVEKLSDQLQQEMARGDQSKEALVDLLTELETNPYGVQESLKNYAFVFGATTGQSVANKILRAKDFSSQRDVQKMLFDTVIVDEAARTSPRDLLIPMVLAKKRIILVGDHRQLPHMINEEAARRLEANHDDIVDEADYIKRSMFEYLFSRLKQLELNDGIKRTVTLDAQYRTHPQLGELNSRFFYDDYGEGYRSPMPPEFFAHSLPAIEGHALAWIDTSCYGKSTRVGTSLANKIEAQAIAKWLKFWMNHEAGKQLTFGVITFYSGQVNEIMQTLSHKTYNMTRRSGEGYTFTKEYESLKRGSGDSIEFVERLRVGTVDSFQGMEFDVVLLSVVRTSKGYSGQKKESKVSKEKRFAQLFGFLCSPNRLCVSMSRQKRALIIVGDKELARLDEAREAIPIIHEFYETCVKEKVVLSTEPSEGELS